MADFDCKKSSTAKNIWKPPDEINETGVQLRFLKRATLFVVVFSDVSYI